MRALRPDKLTVAALAATLALYRDGQALSQVPALAMLAATEADVRRRAERICAAVTPRTGRELSLRATESAIGGGSMPTVRLPSWGVTVVAASARKTDIALRNAAVPVVGRIADDRVILDLRTVLPEDEAALIAAIEKVRS
jgi:L-seryl-tRNA(Ser) seleniumtransferase